VADETMSPEEQAANDAQTATNADEQTWAGKIEERLAALEDKAGLAKKADTADTKEETK
jgi:hypothetical protein